MIGVKTAEREFECLRRRRADEMFVFVGNDVVCRTNLADVDDEFDEIEGELGTDDLLMIV